MRSRPKEGAGLAEHGGLASEFPAIEAGPAYGLQRLLPRALQAYLQAAVELGEAANQSPVEELGAQLELVAHEGRLLGEEREELERPLGSESKVGSRMKA